MGERTSGNGTKRGNGSYKKSTYGCTEWEVEEVQKRAYGGRVTPKGTDDVDFDGRRGSSFFLNRQKTNKQKHK